MVDRFATVNPWVKPTATRRGTVLPGSLCPSNLPYVNYRKGYKQALGSLWPSNQGTVCTVPIDYDQNSDKPYVNDHKPFCTPTYSSLAYTFCTFLNILTVLPIVTERCIMASVDQRHRYTTYRVRVQHRFAAFYHYLRQLVTVLDMSNLQGRGVGQL